MSDLGNRQSGTAGGALRSSDAVTPQLVAVEIPPELAQRHDVQLTAVALVNMLARSADLVVETQLQCPATPVTIDHPLVSRGKDLATELAALAERVGPDAVRVRTAGPDPAVETLTLVLGAGSPRTNAVRVVGNGWWGQATARAVTMPEDSANPIGPTLAASLALSIVMWNGRGLTTPPTHMQLSGWDLTMQGETATELPADGPRRWERLSLSHVLAGAGAVGNAHLLVLATTPNAHGVVSVYDPDAVDTTNRNRCLLFFHEDIGQPKVDAVKDRFKRGGDLRVVGVNDRAEGHVTRDTTLVSCVDKPEGRQALQRRYPRLALQASTKDLRTELLRTDPDADTACLQCYNQPSQTESDDDLRQRFGVLDESSVARLAADLDGESDALQEWIRTGRCSAVAGAMLERFRHQEQEEEFAVGFVSVAAGTLLAAQLIKETLAAATDLRGERARGRLSFADPDAATNHPGLYRRDPNCPACDPERPAGRRWRQRTDTEQ